jgi:hypothetical protein
VSERSHGSPKDWQKKRPKVKNITQEIDNRHREEKRRRRNFHAEKNRGERREVNIEWLVTRVVSEEKAHAMNRGKYSEKEYRSYELANEGRNKQRRSLAWIKENKKSERFP